MFFNVSSYLEVVFGKISIHVGNLWKIFPTGRNIQHYSGKFPLIREDFPPYIRKKILKIFFLISNLPFLSLEASVKSWKRCLWSDLARYLFNTFAFILVSPSVPSWDIIQLHHFSVSGGLDNISNSDWWDSCWLPSHLPLKDRQVRLDRPESSGIRRLEKDVVYIC